MNYAIFNHKGERMYQFGYFSTEEQALRALAAACERYPDAKFKIKVL